MAQKREHYLVVRLSESPSSDEKIIEAIYNKGASTINNNIPRYRINKVLVINKEKYVIGIFNIDGIKFGDKYKKYKYELKKLNDEDKKVEYDKWYNQKIDLRSCFPYQSFDEKRLEAMMN